MAAGLDSVLASMSNHNISTPTPPQAVASLRFMRGRCRGVNSVSNLSGFLCVFSKHARYIPAVSRSKIFYCRVRPAAFIRRHRIGTRSQTAAYPWNPNVRLGVGCAGAQFARTAFNICRSFRELFFDRIARCAHRMVAGDLSERWPCGTRRDILAAATAATRMCADVRNGKGGAELGDEQVRGKDGVMPASVAPAEYFYAVALQVAERGCAAVMILACEASLLQSAHECSRFPSSDRNDEKNITGTFVVSQAMGLRRGPAPACPLPVRQEIRRSGLLKIDRTSPIVAPRFMARWPLSTR